MGTIYISLAIYSSWSFSWLAILPACTLPLKILPIPSDTVFSCLN